MVFQLVFEKSGDFDVKPLFVVGKVFFCRPAATLETDFALLPKFLFGGALLSLPVCFLTYSLKDIVEGLLFPSPDDAVEPSEE